MKKFNKKFLTAGLCSAFVASALGGGILMSQAGAETTDPIDSLSLVQGASVRYVENNINKTGLMFSLKMKADDYETMTGENSEYSDVTFGVLIAPEYYHDIYPFNYENVFGAEAKYYLNDAEESGKEKIYNLTGSLVQNAGGEVGYCYFNASLIDILGVDDSDAANNIALDFRGVGYVKYTLSGETVYKFVDDDGVISDANAYDDDNVRSMATVADAAIKENTAKIKELDVEGKTEEDQKTIDFLTQQNAALKSSYLDRVNYELQSRMYTETIDPLTTTTITVPTSVWALKDSYLAKQYDLTWTFCDEEVTAGQEISTPTMTGVYTLVGTATNKTNDNDVQTVYTKTYTVAAPKLNNQAATTYPHDRVVYHLGSDTYSNVANLGGILEFDVGSVTDGDYVVQADITCEQKNVYGNMPGLIIGVGGAKRLTFRTLSGSKKLTIESYNGSVSGTMEISGFTHNLGAVGENTNIKVARVNGVYYVYDAYNGTDVFLCSIDRDGIHPNGNVTLNSWQNKTEEETKFNTALSSFFSAGSQNAVGIYMTTYSGNSSYTYKLNYTSGSDAAAPYSYGAVSVNGKTTTYLGSVTYDNGAYTANSVEVTSYTTALVPLKNTVTDGDYTMDMTVTVSACDTYGHFNGLRIYKGASSVTLKYCKAETNKLILDIRNSSNKSAGDLIIDNFNNSCDKNGTMLCSVVRLNGAYYIYNSEGTLGVVLDKTNGVQIQNGFTYTINKTTDLTTCNSYLESFFSEGDTDVSGIFSSKYVNGTGTYSFTYNFVRGTEAANKKVNPTEQTEE